MTKLSISSLKTPSHRQFCFIHPSNELLVYENTISPQCVCHCAVTCFIKRQLRENWCPNTEFLAKNMFPKLPLSLLIVHNKKNNGSDELRQKENYNCILHHLLWPEHSGSCQSKNLSKLENILVFFFWIWACPSRPGLWTPYALWPGPFNKTPF